MALRGLKRQVVGFLRAHAEWHSKGSLIADRVWKHEQGKNYGKRYLPETVAVLLRDLERSGVIAVMRDGISVKYRYIPEEFRDRYIPTSLREQGKEDALWRPGVTVKG